MKKIILILCLLFLSFNAYSAPVIIDPGTTLNTYVGPDPWHGRGFIFRAEENFSIASLGMDLNFTGAQDFRVSVYANDGTGVGGRGALISETLYPGMTDDGSAFFTLAHAQSFTTGSFYELLIRYTDGVNFNYYSFQNTGLDPINGFAAGSSMLILDGTDFDNYTNNFWLVRFQIDGDPSAPPTTYSVGGNVSGLTGSVTLQNNGGDDIIKTTNDGFAFVTELEDGVAYEVTVSAQPTGQSCSVTNGSGTIATADVTNVDVNCVDIAPPAPVVPVPTMSEWALMLLTMLLGLMVFANRRRLF